eukprot:CAMPEP_0180682250 /NCGR_PEP_ID=MMETSP1037_2-20121125/70450_1 /TAXON_ID=632150 /ORGANISM="Azadinium spinosum, Strain 3D9" /LENGTH=36 /DNA_ID= /DNA_START= /DNA_END= /DNA_ORIENTATION=
MTVAPPSMRVMNEHAAETAVDWMKQLAKALSVRSSL